MKTLFVLALAASTVATSCMKSDSTVVNRLSALVKADDSQDIDLANIGPSSWNKVCVLRPYTDNKRAQQILGFYWNAALRTSILTSDGINVLVFVKDEAVVAFSEYPRSLGDFSKFPAKCLPRNAAKVSRQAGTGGWLYLIPSQ